MNILGLVSALLIIFSIITGYIFSQFKDSKHMSKDLDGHLKVVMDTESEQEMYNYKIHKKVRPTTPKQDEPKKDHDVIAKNDNKEHSSKKEIKADKNLKIYECSLLNLNPLLENENKTLYELFAKLFKNCYPSLFQKQRAEYLFLDELISILKDKSSKGEEIILEKISFKDELFQDNWYHMLKGSKYYDFDSQIGSKSILELMTIKDKKNKICVPTASKEILSLLYNTKIAQKIYALKEKNKDEIEKILKEERLDHTFDELIELDHTKHSKNTYMVICKDQNTQISIRSNFAN